MDNRFFNLARPSFLSSSLVRPDWTKDLTRDESKLWLNKNENPDPILNEKIQSLIGSVKNFAINTYPETAKIYEKLAKMDHLHAKNFLLTQGSDGAIRAVFDVFVAPGDIVLHTNPTFAMYDVYSKMYGAKEVSFDYQYTDEGPKFDVEKFFEFIKHQKPKLVCLPNPDSPTGTILSENKMNELLQLTNEIGSLLLIDEAYFPFYKTTVIKEVNTFHNLLVCRSFSKAWGAAGFRVGYLAGHSSLIELLHKSRPMYELSTFSSELINLLLDCQDDVLKSVERLEEGRKYFTKELEALGFTVTKSYGNFLHVNFGKCEEKIAAALKDVVLYRTEFNNASCLKGFSRFSLATKDQFEIIVKKIKSVIS
jgi:histidinol-phosphate aminotransferase